MADISFVFEDEMKKYRVDFLKNCPPPLTVSKGFDLCKQCTTRNWMYYLLDGIVKVYIADSAGNERIIDFMKDNTLIGMDCIEPDVKSVVSIQALTTIHVLPFNKEVLKVLLKNKKDFGYDLAIYYGKVLRQVAYSAASSGIGDPLVRLANFIYLYMDTITYNKLGYIEMTQEDIAAAISLSRSQIAKMCKKLRDEGVLKTANRSVYVLDKEALKAHCRF